MDEQNLFDFENLRLSSQVSIQKNAENNILLYGNESLCCFSIDSTQSCFTALENQKISVVRPINFSKSFIQKNHALNEKTDFYCQTRYVVLLINGKYLLCNLSGHSNLRLELDSENKLFTINADKLFLDIDIFENLQEIDCFIVKQNIEKYHYRDFAVGIMVNYTQKIDQVSNFASLCGCLSDTNILLIANDYEIQSLQTNDFILETLIKKASLCNVGLVLENSCFTNKNKDDKLDLILQRNSTPVLIDGYPLLDVLSENNEQALSEIYTKLQKNSCGLRQKMLWEYDIPEVDKCLLKEGASIVEFGTKIDAIIEKYNQYCKQFGLKYNFIENFFDEKSIDCDMVVNDSIRSNIYQFINNLILNGYTNLSILINDSKKKISNRFIAKKVFPIFFTQNILISSEFVKKITDNKSCLDYFIKIVTFRQNLDIMYADFIYNRLSTNSTMYNFVTHGKKNFGVIFKDLLYVSLSYNSLFRSMFFVPEGFWFDIEQQVVLSGGYYLNNTKSDMKFFLKQNSVLVEKNSKKNESGFCDLEITIFCKDNIHTTIYENENVSHKFDVHFSNDKLNIEYDTTSINRMITFVIVIDTNDKTFDDAKSINYNNDEIFFTQNGNVLKFLTCNIQNHNEIKIC